jgi:hypothetical protein
VAQLFSLGIVPHFMRIPHIIIGAALMAVFVIGCKRSSPSHLPAGSKDLGVIEFTEDTPTQFSLGGGRGCSATAKRIGGDNITMDFVFMRTNADRTVTELGNFHLSTLPGRQCVVPLDISSSSTPTATITFMPKWKAP